MALPKEWAERLSGARRELFTGSSERVGYWLGKLPARLADEPQAMALRGVMRVLQGARDEGVGLLARANALEPESPEIAEDFAEALVNQGRRAEAMTVLRACVSRRPGEIAMLRRIFNLAHSGGSPVEQAEATEAIIVAVPESAEAWFLRSVLATKRRLFSEALASGEKGMAMSPGDPQATCTLFAMLYSGADPREVRVATERWCAARFAAVEPGEARRSRKPMWREGERLRVGYLSGDFRAHVVMRFMSGILRNHDRSRVHVTAYACNPREDNVTRNVQTMCDAYRNVSHLSDEAAAAQIEADRIDVLVELGGHTESARPGILAYRPAPVQVNYQGYPATTGMPAVDFRISDAIADPPGMTDAYCTEKLWRLPRCNWAFELASGEVFDPGVKSPTERGLPLAWGSFNLLSKVCERTTALWSKVLAACPGTSLVMTDRVGLRDHGPAMEKLVRELTAGGASPEAVRLEPWSDDPIAHRARLADVDVLLDPLAYNGTTTTCEGLYFGVPTLTLPGASHVSRVGASLMTAVGLEEFVARDEADFVAKARELAESPTRLAGIRKHVREKFLASPLFDHKGMARAMEEAYFGMVEEIAAARR